LIGTVQRSPLAIDILVCVVECVHLHFAQPAYLEARLKLTREYVTRSPEETIALGRELASLLSPPKLVILRGDLGAGKTTLVKGIAHGFQAASEEDVTSPTFTLIHEYRGALATLYHIDLYRIDTQRELDTLALDDLMGESNVLLIEWGEKFARFQGGRDVEITLHRISDMERRIEVND
jgi:tRNA threonylcarbamoyladenosine biosynthesis protein TsaE